MVGIYKITNKSTGQIYIGQSDNCERRLNEHKQERFVPIDMWINVLGKEQFDYEIVEECLLNELDVKEQYYIDLYHSDVTGYNFQKGGNNNSSGEGNGRARLTEKDVIAIRMAYKEHRGCKETYELYKDKISFSHFWGVWQGRSWSNIMPEVFTEENKKFYTSGIRQDSASLTPEEVLKYRKLYVDKDCKSVYAIMCEEKGKDFLKETTFKKILVGDVRDNSVYKNIPVYKKQKKQWFFQDEPVSTILESEEQGCY